MFTYSHKGLRTEVSSRAQTARPFAVLNHVGFVFAMVAITRSCPASTVSALVFACRFIAQLAFFFAVSLHPVI